MPRPVYLLCSQSYAVDRESNQISFFNLIEEVKIVKRPDDSDATDKQAVAHKHISMRIVSAWMKADDDSPDQVFEVEVAIKLPKESGGHEETVISRPTLSFTKPFHRLLANEFSIPGVEAPGILWFECRIRRAGEKEWLARQEYPILLTPVETAATESGKKE
jgi:hypothetical protein